MEDKRPISYRDSGVDIAAKSGAIAGAKAAIESTLDGNCLSRVGSFGGLFRLPVEDYREPVLVSSTDSVGTKVKVAIAAGRHDSVGRDIVNHCVNDILVQGAIPLFFLDYVGISRVEPFVFDAIVEGLAGACREAGCALIGGETAEMPDVYAPGEYDLVGTIVGVVERERILNGSAIRVGDRLIGLPSNGLHTNGYTLARKILFEREGLAPDSRIPELDGTVADALLAVHRCYLAPVKPLLADGAIHGIAHITGGGLLDNVPRVLPEGTGARIRRGALPVPPIFRVLAERGPVDEAECWQIFNMGVGMVLMVGPDDAGEVLRRVRETHPEAEEIGEVIEGAGAVRLE